MKCFKIKSGNTILGNINTKVIFFVFILLGFIENATIPVGGLFHLVIPWSEAFIVIYLLFGIILTKGRISIVSLKYNSLVNTFKAFLLFGIYIIVSRIYMLLYDGFDAELFTYPRISFFFGISIVFIYFVINKVCNDCDRYKGILFFVFCICIIETVYLIENKDIRSSTFLTNINIFVCLIIITLPTIISVYFNCKNQKLKYCSLLIALYSSALVFFSGSRAGTLLILGIFLVEFFLEKKISRKILLIIILIAGICLLLSFQPNTDIMDSLQRGFSSITNLFLNKYSENAKISDGVRNNIWNDAWENIIEHPFLGPGNLTFDFYMDIYYVHQSAHNFFLEILMSYGFVGFPLFVYVFIKSIKLFVSRTDKYTKRKVIITTAVYLAFSFVEPTFVERVLLFVFLVVVGIRQGKIN